MCVVWCLVAFAFGWGMMTAANSEANAAKKTKPDVKAWAAFDQDGHACSSIVCNGETVTLIYYDDKRQPSKPLYYMEFRIDGKPAKVLAVKREDKGHNEIHYSDESAFAFVRDFLKDHAELK